VRGRHRYLIPGEGREEDRVPGEPLEQVAPGDHCADRLPVAHRLAQRDEVGDDAESLE
jgi:hypothetical protein